MAVVDPMVERRTSRTNVISSDIKIRVFLTSITPLADTNKRYLTKI